MTRADTTFPEHLLDYELPGSVGKTLARWKSISLHPPRPWGQWFYSKWLDRHGRKLPGDMAEFGVALGGMAIFLGLWAQKHGAKMWALDSFEGLPPPDPSKDNPYFVTSDYSSSARDLYESFRDYVATAGLEDTIVPVKGFFAQSLPKLPKRQRFRFVHIDVDLFSSCTEVLDDVWERLPDGGAIALDDFFHHSQGPSRALAEFCNRRRIQPTLHVIFPYSVLFTKNEARRGTPRRSIDGNVYSFAMMRHDKVFRAAFEESLKASRRAGDAEFAEIFDELLRGDVDRTFDVYRYWLGLAAYWDRFDTSGREGGTTRAPIQLRNVHRGQPTPAPPQKKAREKHDARAASVRPAGESGRPSRRRAR